LNSHLEEEGEEKEKKREIDDTSLPSCLIPFPSPKRGGEEGRGGKGK